MTSFTLLTSSGPKSRGSEAEFGRTAQNSSWIVSFQTSGAHRPIFLACAGGGDILDYRDLAFALPNDQPIYGFGLPPLEKGMRFPTVEYLAVAYVRKVRELQPHGPYRLCGHSFGGLVVFQMAILLEKEGEDIELLALVDVKHPNFRAHMTTRSKIVFQLTYLRDRSGRYAKHLATGQFVKIGHDIVFYICSRAKRSFWKAVELASRKLKTSIPNAIQGGPMILSMAWHAYNPIKYNGTVVLFVASERPPEYRTDPTLGWKGYATGELLLYKIPGDHYTMLHRPNVQLLAETLMSFLARDIRPRYS